MGLSKKCDIRYLALMAVVAASLICKAASNNVTEIFVNRNTNSKLFREQISKIRSCAMKFELVSVVNHVSNQLSCFDQLTNFTICSRSTELWCLFVKKY